MGGRSHSLVFQTLFGVKVRIKYGGLFATRPRTFTSAAAIHTSGASEGAGEAKFRAVQFLSAMRVFHDIGN